MAKHNKNSNIKFALGFVSILGISNVAQAQSASGGVMVGGKVEGPQAPQVSEPGAVFPPLSYEQALSNTTNAMSQVSGHDHFKRIATQTENLIIDASKNPTVNEKRAARNAGITMERFTALVGRSSHDNTVYLNWMASKGCTGSGRDWSPNCNQLISELRAKAVQILDEARGNAPESMVQQAEAFLWWADYTAPYADVQVALLTGVVTSLPESYWVAYFPKPPAEVKIVPKSLFERLLEDRANNRDPFEGRRFAPRNKEEMKEFEGEFGCVYREGDPPAKCGKIISRNNGWQVGSGFLSDDDEKNNKALMTLSDENGDDLSTRQKTEGFLNFFGRGGLTFGNNLDAGSVFQYGFKAGGRINSFEIAGVVSLLHVPTGGARDSLGPQSFGYRTAFAPGISAAWAPWFKKRFGIALGAELDVLISHRAVGVNGLGFLEARWRLGAKQRGMIGVGIYAGRTALMKDLGIPVVVHDLQDNIDPAARKHNQWSVMPALNGGFNF